MKLCTYKCSQIPLCRNEVSRAHSALTGTLIRLAECMGLHRDPKTYSTSPIEIHVRRLVWYQICFLDLRTCEATGPRPQIRPDDYDTQFPLNIDDVDLDRAESGDTSVDIKKDRTYFTDMTITRMRFECYEMHRVIWNERPKLDKKRVEGERKVTITSLLLRIQAFRTAMEKTYVPMLNKTVPLHALLTEIYGILSDRLYIQLLQKYLSSDRAQMPARLREVIMSSAVMILEHSMTIELQPALAPWAWYVGAFHQYHVALLLINELYAGTREPAMEERIWRTLDYSFNMPSGMTNLQKIRAILEDLSGKSQIYASMKKWRAPTNMPHAGPRKHTPGYKARQKEEREERERSGSVQSRSSSTGAASFGFSGSSTGQPTSPPQQSQSYQFQQAQAQPKAMSFPGSMPTVDWGSIDLPATATFQVPQQPLASPDAFNPNNFTQGMSTGGLMPTPIASASQRQSSDGSSPAGQLYGSGSGGSPMDALNEIDWVYAFLLSVAYDKLIVGRMISSRCLAVARWARAICLFHRLRFHSSVRRICDGRRRKGCNMMRCNYFVNEDRDLKQFQRW